MAFIINLAKKKEENIVVVQDFFFSGLPLCQLPAKKRHLSISGISALSMPNDKIQEEMWKKSLIIKH